MFIERGRIHFHAMGVSICLERRERGSTPGESDYRREDDLSIDGERGDGWY